MRDKRTRYLYFAHGIEEERFLFQNYGMRTEKRTRRTYKISDNM